MNIPIIESPREAAETPMNRAHQLRPNSEIAITTTPKPAVSALRVHQAQASPTTLHTNCLRGKFMAALELAMCLMML